MRVFVTGASGFIGSAVVPELLQAGHSVLGLARSDASAAKLEKAGVEVHRGDITDLDSLQAGAAKTDGTIHLGFIHDFQNFPAAIASDRKAIEAMCKTLEGSGKPFLFASGTVGLTPGKIATEATPFNAGLHPRAANAELALDFAKRNVRVCSIRYAPTVHGEGDHGFIKMLIDIARDKGASAYIGDGSNCWTAVHRFDAARLTYLALEKAKAGSVMHAVAEEAIPTRTIAEVIGRKLSLPVKSVAPEQAAEHFGWFSRFFSIDQPASNLQTRKTLDWQPKHVDLVSDLEAGHYFK